MYIILNRANLVVCITSGVRYVAQQENGKITLATEQEPTAIYATDNDAFYPLDNGGEWRVDTYRAVEVFEVPAQVVAGYWYYSCEFFTTPEKQAEYEAAEAQKSAALVSSIAFVTLAEGGQIDDVTASENSTQFAEWAYPVNYTTGNIRRYKGKLYRCVQAHASQEGWTPDTAASLWAAIGDPAEEWPEWAQPIGGHDAYELGAKVSHKGKHWVSTSAGNVWEPGVYGWEQDNTK